MTKAELVEFVAENADLTKADAARALDAVVAGVTKGLKKERKVFNRKKTIFFSLFYFLFTKVNTANTQVSASFSIVKKCNKFLKMSIFIANTNV